MVTAIGSFLGWHVFMHVGAVSIMLPKGVHAAFLPSGPTAVAFMAMLSIFLRIMRHDARDARAMQ